MKTYPSIRTLAKAVGKSRTALSGWTKHPLWTFSRVPPWSHSDLPAMKQWAIATLRPALKSVPDPLLVGGNSPALERYRMARAALAEIELRKQRRELCDVHEVKTWINTHVVALRQRMLALPAVVVLRMEGCDLPERQSILDTMIREALTDLSNAVQLIQEPKPPATPAER